MDIERTDLKLRSWKFQAPSLHAQVTILSLYQCTWNKHCGHGIILSCRLPPCKRTFITSPADPWSHMRGTCCSPLDHLPPIRAADCGRFYSCSRVSLPAWNHLFSLMKVSFCLCFFSKPTRLWVSALLCAVRLLFVVLLLVSAASSFCSFTLPICNVCVDVTCALISCTGWILLKGCFFELVHIYAFMLIIDLISGEMPTHGLSIMSVEGWIGLRRVWLVIGFLGLYSREQV